MGALITAKENFHAVSLSGGKDSTCLLLLMIERGLPIDAVIWADISFQTLHCQRNRNTRLASMGVCAAAI